MFLLDTTVTSDLGNPESQGHAAARAFLEQNNHRLDEIHICVITLAEMQFGLEILKLRTPAVKAATIEAIERRMEAAKKLAEPFPVSRHVAAEHARLRALWAYAVSPVKAQKGGLKSLPVESWHQDWPASQLQITENDLWIAAVALAHDLTLVARDKDYERLAQAVTDLKVVRLN